MGKKQRTEGAAKRDLSKFCAFWAVVISAVLYLLTLIFRAIGGNLGTAGDICALVASVMLGIALVFPAWSYACSKGKGWRIVCIIVFIFYFVMAIVGGAGNLF